MLQSLDLLEACHLLAKRIKRLSNQELSGDLTFNQTSVISTEKLWQEKKKDWYSLSVSLTEVQHPGLLALCGPNKVMDESTCECVCQNGLTEHSCDPGWKLDHDTCKKKGLSFKQ